MNSVNRRILHLAWPAIATNITTPLLSLADVAIVGHLDHGRLIGAVAVGGTLFNILYWLFAFLRMGTSGLTAQAYGAADRAEQRNTMLRGLAIAVGGGLLLPLLAQIAGYDAVRLVAGAGETDQAAWHYFRLAVIGAPGVLVSYVVSGWLLGMQRSAPIMWIALATNLLNIALSVTFVYGLNMGLTGLALGTATAQIVGASVGLVVAFGYFRRIPIDGSSGTTWRRRLQSKGFRQAHRWKAMFKINGDIFLRTVCLASVTLWFTHAGAVTSDDVLAANALLMQLFLVFSYFMDGFAFGGEALAGKYYGASDSASLSRTIRALFGWGIATSAVFTVLYFCAGDYFLSWLSDSRHIRDVADDYRFWVVLVPFMGFSAFTWDGVMIGLTQTRSLLLSMAVAMAVFFGIYFGGTALRGFGWDSNHVLWCAFVVYLGVRGLILTFVYQRFMRRWKSETYVKQG